MTPRRTTTPVPDADLSVEKEFATELADLTPTATTHDLVIAGMDEVGRGALAGPVTVGIVAVRPQSATLLAGLRDSKKLTAKARTERAEAITDWAYHGTGSATPAEIDDLGLTTALGVAGLRALHSVCDALGRMPDGLVLDGNSNWLSSLPGHLVAHELGDYAARLATLPVRTLIKADARCATVSAAAILAKVTRDTYMVELSEQFPDYGWDKNKGYGAAVHRHALQTLGMTPHHRTSWNLTGKATPAPQPTQEVLVPFSPEQ